MILLAPLSVLPGATTQATVLDWRSSKLNQASHSSMHSESQAVSMTIDELEFVKVFWSLIQNPCRDPKRDSTVKLAGPVC